MKPISLKMPGKATGFFLMLFIIASGATAQKTDSLKYDHLDLFGPVSWPVVSGDTRSANGKPGKQYWQNRPDYTIRAKLNETAKDTTIEGEVTIAYTNNSPDDLEYLWLQLDQNLFRADSRGAATTPVEGDRFNVSGFSSGGMHIESVGVIYKDGAYAVSPVITDTRMQVRLRTPLKAAGDKVNLKIKYRFAIPVFGADRMGRKKFRDGYVYEIAQWYPRMCVYDDVEGWNTLPYMGLGEFYCDYGNFDYFITAPARMVVLGSGDLQNEEQVLTTLQRERLAAARRSDQTVMIVKPGEAGRHSAAGFKTWHFKMQNSRDIAWAASDAFIWDAAKVNFPSGRKGIAMSAYPAESAGPDSWGRATEYLKASMEIYSRQYFEYPWNTASNISGVALGMEYPGIVFCLSDFKKKDLWIDVTHEIGHNWFPMIVGSNERKYAWQDEGFNTFINEYATAQFNKGEYYNPRAAQPARIILPFLQRLTTPTMVAPEAMGLEEYGQYYVKTSAGLNMLRNVVLGPERFDYAFGLYIRRWAFRHPLPYDFFRTMNDAAGEDLNWFWKEWFFNNWKLDQGVRSVHYVKDDPAQGALITLVNKERMAMPATLAITQKNGKTEIVRLPVNIWQRGSTWTFRYSSASEIVKIVLDPEQQLPDADLSDNTWTSNTDITQKTPKT